MIGTLTGFRAYALERGDSAPTGATDADALAALVRASDYIQFSYVRRFGPGHNEGSEGVEQATYVAAALELGTPGFFSKTYTPGERKVLTEVKGVKWQVLDQGATDGMAAPVSSKIEAMLGQYLNCAPGVFLV